MEILSQLGVALGLASLAGVNLYLTVLLTGLAIRFEWVHLAAQYQSLDVLAHPVVIIVAGLLFVMQFFADKIPWVDSLWDSVHTIIRPVGGTLLALQAVGTMPGYVEVAAALLAGGAALTMHSAKAGTRLLINNSPEPASNIAMSLAEDVAVTGGVALTLLNPVIALVVFSGLLTVIWLLFPRLWRLIRTTMWLVWHKLKLPGRRETQDAPVDLKCEVTDELRDLLQIGAGLSSDEVKWTVRCHSGKSRGVRGFCANLSGILVAPARPDCLYFATIKGLRSRLFKFPLNAAQVEVESKFLSENVAVSSDGMRAVFRFPRGRGALVESLALRIRESLTEKIAPLEQQAVPPIEDTQFVEPETAVVEETVVPPPTEILPSPESGPDGKISPLPAVN
ncbi:MAG: DUF4126 domain-containing protein [Verrucomicrobia bacterium]|nr:DUF4126 domain-containing protein [Verrucomicrobiota bacterium]